MALLNFGGTANSKSFISFTSKPIICTLNNNPTSKRNLILQTSLLSIAISLTPQLPPALSSPQVSSSSKSILSSIENTSSWYRFYGNGFAIRVPPEFQDVMEPEDFSAGMNLYGDRAKEKEVVARFVSSDGYAVLNVITRPSSQLKITFLEFLITVSHFAHDVHAGGSTVYSARSIKIKEESGFRTYYFYEFGKDDLHLALTAGARGGKVVIAGATAPQSKWDTDGVKLRSAVISLTIL
ncbi:hypothetical protein TSUD_34200 [Trifolium subterraneum]|uniref:PsbP C-terminal domain-containing protein n=1 Tax=Trifolium subterraneum TaxID=3900 RepID=A0A2Z6PBR0_TRISU|nr:hypothetical protein TSUD_34200 [Trifolium subterraneum]